MRLKLGTLTWLILEQTVQIIRFLVSSAILMFKKEAQIMLQDKDQQQFLSIFQKQHLAAISVIRVESSVRSRLHAERIHTVDIC